MVEYFTPGLAEQLTAFEGPRSQVRGQEPTQQVPRLPRHPRLPQGLARDQGQQGRAMEDLGLPLPRLDPPGWLTGDATIAFLRPDGTLSGLIQQGAITKFPQQPQFKLTQAGFEVGSARQVLEGGMVEGK